MLYVMNTVYVGLFRLYGVHGYNLIPSELETLTQVTPTRTTLHNLITADAAMRNMLTVL